MTRQVRFLVVGLLLAALASLAAFGIVGKGRSGDGIGNADGAVLYAAGRAWREGRNPYEHRDLKASVVHEPGINLDRVRFFYLPQSSPFCLLLAQFPYAVARHLWLGINLLSITALAGMAMILIRQSSAGREDVLGMGLMAAAIIGNPFTTHVVWMGQTSLVVTAFLLAAWILIRKKQWLWGGIFLGLAGFKPQLLLLAGVWLLLEREWKALLVGLATSVLLCIHPMLVHGGPIGMFNAWRGGIASDYGELRYNQPGNPHVTGLESLLAAAGLPLPGVLFMIAGVALAGVAWRYRDRFNPEDVLGLLMGGTFVFLGYLHDYDFVALIPLLVALWLHFRARPSEGIWLAPLIVLLFLPQQFVRKLDVAVLNHWRTVVVLILTWKLAGCSWNRPASPRLSGRASPENQPAAEGVVDPRPGDNAGQGGNLRP